MQGRDCCREPLSARLSPLEITPLAARVPLISVFFFLNPDRARLKGGVECGHFGAAGEDRYAPFQPADVRVDINRNQLANFDVPIDFTREFFRT
jgi:hypothetical protein